MDLEEETAAEVAVTLSFGSSSYCAAAEAADLAAEAEVAAAADANLICPDKRKAVGHQPTVFFLFAFVKPHSAHKTMSGSFDPDTERSIIESSI